MEADGTGLACACVTTAQKAIVKHVSNQTPDDGIL